MQRLFLIMSMITVTGCGGTSPAAKDAPAATAPATERPYLLDRVDDAAVVQVYADGFAQLPLKDKTLIWHLYQAAIAGRDIFYDQRYVHNLEMRDVLEAILTHAATVEPATPESPVAGPVGTRPTRAPRYAGWASRSVAQMRAPRPGAECRLRLPPSASTR